MNYKEHLTVSLFANTLVLLALQILGYTIELSFWLIGAYLIFTLLPDIDHRYSIMSRIFYISYMTVFLLGVFQIYSGQNSGGFAKIITAGMMFLIHLKISRSDHKHRNFPHTILFGAVVCLIFFVMSESTIATAVAVVSFSSHLVCDRHIKLR